MKLQRRHILTLIILGLSHLTILAETSSRITLESIESLSNSQINLKDTLSKYEEVIVSYSDSRRLHFHYKITELDEFENIKYKVEGFDNNWLKDNDFNKIIITNLEPGRYWLKVGIFNREESVEEKWVHLRVLPAFWMTSLFKLCLVLILIGLFLRLYIKNIRLKNKITGYNNMQ